MTDVAGPPVPPARLSSLPIRGAAAATGAGESDLEANCSMAQAFEIPTGNRTATGWSSLRSHLNEFPDALSRSPLLAGPTPQAGSVKPEYGSALGSPQAHKHCTNAARGRPDSGLGDLPQVNQSCRI